MHGEEIPLKRHLPWDIKIPLKGILILAVGLLLVLSPDPLYAPLKWHLRQLRGLSLKLSFL